MRPTSLSAEARVARPNRVYLDSAANATAIAMMVAARKMRSPTNLSPPTSKFFFGKIGLTTIWLRPAASASRPVIERDETQRADRLRDRCTVAERPEQQQVREHPHDRLDQHGDDERRPQRPLAADVDRLGQERDDQQQLTVAEEGVRVRRVQSERAGGEVEHTRTAVDHHERDGQRSEHGAVAGAEQHEVQMIGQLALSVVIVAEHGSPGRARGAVGSRASISPAA